MGIMSIRRYTKRLLAPVVVVIVVTLTIGLFYIGMPSSQGDYYSYAGPSLKLKGEKVKDDVFNNYLVQASQQASQYAQFSLATEGQVRDNAVNLATRDLAFKQEMKRAKIKVTNADIDKIIKKYLPTEEEMNSFMERQKFTSKSQVRKFVADFVERQKFISYQAQKLNVKVSKEEILGALEKITISHILIGTKDASSNKVLRSDAEALKRANIVLQKANAGSDFAQLAKEYSDDPGSKEKGGTYGPMSIDQFKQTMVKEFVDGSLALKEKEISKPIKTQFGYHVIRLDSRTMPTGNDYKEQYKENEENLLAQKAQADPAFENWIQQIYQKADSEVEILDPALRAYRLKQSQKWEEAAKAYEKAVKKSYYKNKMDVYIEAAGVYQQLKQPKEAIAILKKAPVALTDIIEYQVALATAYKENDELKKAQDLLTKFSEAHSRDINVHQKLKETFTSWNLADLAAKEAQLITEIQKQEEEVAKKNQENMEQKYSQPVTGNTGQTTTQPAQ